MTKKEAMDLENKCDNLMCAYVQEDCQVSMALNGRMKVYFDGGFITLEKDHKTVHYLSYTGMRSDLDECVSNITKCIEENREDFEQLMWSYEHVRELEE